MPFARRLWTNPGRLAWIALGFVLGFLALFALGIAFTSRVAGDSVRAASTLSDAYEQARIAVVTEESFERKYRLEPGPDVRGRFNTAAGTLVASLLAARAADTDEHAALVDETLGHHRVYLQAIDRLFAAVDAGEAGLVLLIDNTQTEPSFEQIDTFVTAAAVDHRAAAISELDNLNQLDTIMVAATPVVFLLGFALLLLFRAAFRGFERRLDAGALRELTQARLSEERFRSLVQNAADTVVIVDRSGRITYCSPAIERNWGVLPSVIEGLSFFDAVHRDDAKAARTFFAECLETPGGNIATELRARTLAGGYRLAEVAGNNQLGQDAVDGVVLTFRDITDRKAVEDQLKNLALRDPLTSLANRALFMDRLDHALAAATRHGRSVGVLLLDIDNFKLVNDSLGHEAGDRLLVAVAERLKAEVRAEDTPARFGSDEFTILLEDVATEADAIEVAERIQATLETPFTIDDHELFVGVSIGVALGTGRAAAAESVVRNANLAMYRAKLNGKGRHETFEGSMDAGALARIGLETDLRHALDRNEFRVYYQPIISLVDSRVVEVEALVRWEHPVRGLIQPNDFIPAAEETGLIVPIGQWVLEDACRQTAQWARELPAPAISLSVNLSARQFQHPGLLEDIDRALRMAELDAAALTLEITESVVMKDPVAAAAKLREIKALGVRVAVDDFGTGYSSLAYLKDFPVDSLKIDRSFIQGLGDGGDDSAIVRSIVALGHALHLSVTAEGIETADQLAGLRALQCDRGQGFLFARPVPADQVTLLLVARTARPHAA